MTCLLGRNGVGKTSLLRAIAALQPIASGSITLGRRGDLGLPAYERARRGIAWVPQGREIFPLLTVRENLETGFAALPRGARKVPDEIFELFPVLKTMLGRRGGDLSGGQQQQLAIGRALDHAAEAARAGRADRGHPAQDHQGHRPRHRPICAAAATWPSCWSSSISTSRSELADDFAVMDRGEIVMSGTRETFDAEAVRKHMTV